MTNKNYDSYLCEQLNEKKIMTSNELSDCLIKEFGVTGQNARKIIERSVKGSIIKSSSPVTFGKGRYAYFLKEYKFDKEAIKKISKIYRKPLYRLIEGLDISDGILSYYEALKITASPLERGSTKVSSLEDLLHVLKIKDIIFTTVLRGVKYIFYKKNTVREEELEMVHYAKMKVDAILVKDVIDWLKSINIINTYDNLYRNKLRPSIGVKHNNLVWDAIAYTSTTGYCLKSTTQDEKQTLVVLDVILSRSYQKIDLDGFYDRIQINLNSVKTGRRKIIPIVVFKECPKYILTELKRLGFLHFNINNMYGKNISSIIDSYFKITSVKEVEFEDFEKQVSKALESLEQSGHEDQLKALKGILFEVIIYQTLRYKYPNSEIIPNYIYKDKTPGEGKDKKSEGPYEYDYVIKSSNPKEIIIVELKGYHSRYLIPLGNYQTKNTIKWFFNKTFPIIKKSFSNELSTGYKIKSLYIASCGFETEAMEFLNNTNNNNCFKPANMDVFYDRDKLLTFFDENNFLSLKKIIEKYYK